jgi:hypothetical protein
MNLNPDGLSILLPDTLRVPVLVKYSTDEGRIFSRIDLSIIRLSVKRLSTKRRGDKRR